jgi:hypothetical protein
MRAAAVPEPYPSVAPPIMAAPELIAVRRTEEEAGYVSFRPVVRQNFPLHDLLGLVLGVTGKIPSRIQKILRSGSVSFHSYHYSWDGFAIDEQELASLLARFPDADPGRAFRREACTVALLEAGELSLAQSPRLLLELGRAATSRRRLFRGSSFWDALLATATSGRLEYDGYSYQWRADRYRLALDAGRAEALAAAAKSLAPRDLCRSLGAFDRASHIIFVCPREGA